MNFLDIGPVELIIVLLIGFLIFRPEKLPRMAAQAGRLWNKFKKASFDITKTITEEIELDKAKDEKTTPQVTSDKKDE